MTYAILRVMAKNQKDYATEFARKGGKARAKALSPERRREISRKAITARWKAVKKGSKKRDAK
jgi:general stress protein YciG